MTEYKKLGVVIIERKKIINFLANWHKANPNIPSVRQDGIGKHFGYNADDLWQLLRQVEGDGIERHKKINKTYVYWKLSEDILKSKAF